MAWEETKAKGAEGLPGEASVVSDGQRWRWFQAAAVLVAANGFFPPVFPCFSLCFFCFCFFFLFFLPFFLFGSFFFLSFGLSTLSFFLFLSHIFIGENKGETWLGRPLCSCSTTTRGARFLLFSLPRGRP